MLVSVGIVTLEHRTYGLHRCWHTVAQLPQSLVALVWCHATVVISVVLLVTLPLEVPTSLVHLVQVLILIQRSVPHFLPSHCRVSMPFYHWIIIIKEKSLTLIIKINQLSIKPQVSISHISSPKLSRFCFVVSLLQCIFFHILGVESLCTCCEASLEYLCNWVTWEGDNLMSGSYNW